MLIELLSPSNYVSFNVKLAEILGLHPAIYISELMNINDKAIRKDKISESSFSLNREYVTKRTTLSIEEQLKIEKNLIKLGIVDKPNDDENCIILNINVLTTLLMSTDEELIDNVKKLNKVKSGRTTKAEAIKKNLKDNITTTNVELYEAYSEWVDSVVSKEGWMSKQAVVMGQSIVDDFSKRNLDTALAIINIAALHGYRDMSWAINKFKDQYKFKREISTPNTPISVSSEAF
jgi:hypothetical protein